METEYLPKKLKHLSESCYPNESLVENIENGDFRIGQCYDDSPAKTYKCKLCGSTEFIVGRGDYFTGIKCGTCKYEICIHEG